ncbi:hypothetical protein AB0L70_06020 [Kribbella sp. NPDC051952]|uniref:hypothetical protein n=1 Tax=Kribbella sp. NPDC051952 TaxID=3154851 RepID=UPI00341247A8
MGEDVRRGWGPAALGAAALLLAVATVVLDLRNGTGIPAAAELDAGWTAVLSGLAQVVPGLLLLHRLPRHPIAWILTGSGLLWVVDGFASSWAAYAIYTSPGLPGASAAYWFYSRFGAFLLLGLPLLILLFPDGKLVTARGWRWLSIVSLALTLLLPLLLLVAPIDVMQRYHDTSLPPEISRLSLDPLSIHLSYDVWSPLLQVAYTAVLVSLVVPFAVTVHRYRAASRERRAQIRWLMWAALIDMIVLLVPFENPPAVPALMFGLAIALTSAAIVVAVTKHRLYAVDRLLSATFLYGYSRCSWSASTWPCSRSPAVSSGNGTPPWWRSRSSLWSTPRCAAGCGNGYDVSSAAPGMIRTRRCPRSPNGSSRPPARTSSFVRSPGRWPRPSVSRTCGWRSSGSRSSSTDGRWVRRMRCRSAIAGSRLAGSCSVLATGPRCPTGISGCSVISSGKRPRRRGRVS